MVPGFHADHIACQGFGQHHFFKEGFRISDNDFFISPGTPSGQRFRPKHHMTAVEFLVGLVVFKGRGKIENVQRPGQIFQGIVEIGS